MKEIIVTFAALILSAQAISKKPNFVFLIADDLGMGDVGCFGNDTIRTPNIDSIASQGAKLSHHLAAAAVCTPSRASFLTGRYAVRQGMEAEGANKVLLFVASSGGLPDNETTFPKLLQQQGYATALIGKWHLGWNCNRKGDRCHHPLNHGFDYFYGMPLTNLKDFGNDGASVLTTYHPEFFTYLNALTTLGVTMTLLLGMKGQNKYGFLCALLFVLLPIVVSFIVRNIKTINSVIFRDDEVVEQPIRLSGLTQRLVKESREFLEAQVRAEKPFVLFLPFVHVHTALFTAPEFANKSRHGRFGDNVEEMDWAVGEILQALQNLDVEKNTFVYFSSDNGGHIEERGLDGQREGGHNGDFKGGKCMGGMEGGIRVPTALKWPGYVPAGIDVSVPTSQMDIFSTVLHVSGIPLPKDRTIDGVNILSLLQNVSQSSPHDFLFHYCGTELHAVRYVDGRDVWKVHFMAPKWRPGTYECDYVCQCYGDHAQVFRPPRLYNLRDDPFEDRILDPKTNPKLQQVMEKIKQGVAEHRKTLDEVPMQFSVMNTLWRPWLQPCCNFPYCSCTDKKHPR